MKAKNSALGLGLLTAFASSLCCIVPLVAILAGTSSLAANFSWIEPAKPYLFGISFLALGFAWYQQLKPVEEDDCGCEVETTSFFQSKKFLSIVTVFAIGMMAFPYYSGSLFASKPGPENNSVLVSNHMAQNIISVEFEVQGMTSGGCEKHVSDALYELEGVVEVTASFKNENTIVNFDDSKTSIKDIEKAIASTGYKVLGHKILNADIGAFPKLSTFVYHVKGMTCGGCESHVNNAVNKLDGIESVSASFKDEKAIVKFDPSKTSKEEVEKAISSTGYIVEGVKEQE